MNSSLRELFGQRVPIRSIDRVASGSPGRLVLAAGPDGLRGLRTISASLALAKRHLPLLDAKHAVEAVMEGGAPTLTLPAIEDEATLAAELAAAGFAMTWVERPRDAEPALAQGAPHTDLG